MSGGQRHQDCARHWELEAARDDRLSEKDLESLRRHLTTCASCKIEQQHLESLGESLRSLPPLPDDVIAARRLRHRLLADVNRSVIGQAPTERRAPRAALASALVALLLLATAVGYRRLGFRASPAPRAAAAPHLPSQSSGDVLVEIAGQPGTQWQRQQLGDELRIQLDSGEIAATIGRHAPEQLVRIQLPDGWIDDLGTVLSVRVEDRRTTSVRVMQGRVRLRLDGRAPVELGAGENWTAAPAAAASVAASAHAPHQAALEHAPRQRQLQHPGLARQRPRPRLHRSPLAANRPRQ